MPRTPTMSRMPLLPLLGLVVALLAVTAAIALTRSEAEASRWVQHTVRAQFAIVRVREHVSEFESAYRGYIVRPLPYLRGDMRRAAADVRQALGEAAREMSDNPQQEARLARLHRLIAQKFERGAQWVRDVDNDRVAERVRHADAGAARRLTAMIRFETAAMMQEEERLLVIRGGQAEKLSMLLAFGLAAVVVLVVVAALLTLYDARRRFAQLESARDAAVAATAATAMESVRRETAESELRQIQKMESIGQLTGGIAHDFNNMLAVVIGGLDMARRRLTTDPERALRSIDTAMEGAERAAALVIRLLAFARRQPLAPVAVDVNRLIGGMFDLLRNSLGKHVKIATRLAPDLWPSFVDVGQLENALLNLVVNARDAMDGIADPRLLIESENVVIDEAYAASHDFAPGDYVSICVTDSGCGMDAATIAKAFDPFFTTKGVGKGTGMGLSQVFGFVKQSHGHIAIRSEPRGGTLLRLYLPRHHGEPQTVTPVAPAAQLRHGSSDEVILVVEDEQRVRHYSVDGLRELGYTVISAPDAAEALLVLALHPEIALLFTDVVMPGMNGRRLAAAALAQRSDLKILFTTGYAQDAVAPGGALDAGVALLAKPFTIAQLANKVRDVLDGVAPENGGHRA